MSAYHGGSTIQNSIVGDKNKQVFNNKSEDKAIENSDLTASGMKLKTNPITSVHGVANQNKSQQDYGPGKCTDEGNLTGLETGQTGLQAPIPFKENNSTQTPDLNRAQELKPAMPSSSRPVELCHFKRKSLPVADQPSVIRRCKPVNVVLPMVVKPSSSSETGRPNRGFGSTARTANLQTLTIKNTFSRQERKIVRVLSVILLALIITFAPYYSVVIVEVYCNDCVKSIIHGIGKCINNTVEFHWLEHLWDHENMFETGVVRANEC